MADDWQKIESDVPCRKCRAVGYIEHKSWESSCGGYEDDHYRCTMCGKDWWIEGADA